MGWLTTVDDGVAATRPGWAWVGQLALVALGTHRGADHLDDLLLGALSELPVPWPAPETPLTVAVAGALTLEGLALVACMGWLLLSAGHPPADRRTWLNGASVRAIVAPTFWAAATLVGTWQVALAAEDAVPMDVPWLPPVVAAVVLWRVGLPGIVRMARQIPAAPRRTGWWTALPLLTLAGLAVRHGLPVWGWL